MTENKTFNLTFTSQEIEILNNIIQNSSPQFSFSTVTAFVSGIQKQIQEQLPKQIESDSTDGARQNNELK